MASLGIMPKPRPARHQLLGEVRSHSLNLLADNIIVCHLAINLAIVAMFTMFEIQA